MKEMLTMEKKTTKVLDSAVSFPTHSLVYQV